VLAMKTPKPAASDGDLPQFELNKRLTIAKTKLAQDQAQGVRTREKANRLQLAKARDDVIEKKLVQNQAAYLFVAMCRKCLALARPTIASSWPVKTHAR
jgi:hypothetical protein